MSSPFHWKFKLIAATWTGLLPCATGAYAGPCTTQIAQLQIAISQSVASPQTGPSAPQSVGAQLHRQPTPDAVVNAESKANADAAAALARAQQADDANNAVACGKALDEARRLYGID